MSKEAEFKKKLMLQLSRFIEDYIFDERHPKNTRFVHWAYHKPVLPFPALPTLERRSSLSKFSL
jgi:hypothetical protein